MFQDNKESENKYWKERNPLKQQGYILIYKKTA